MTLVSGFRGTEWAAGGKEMDTASEDQLLRGGLGYHLLEASAAVHSSVWYRGNSPCSF